MLSWLGFLVEFPVPRGRCYDTTFKISNNRFLLHSLHCNCDPSVPPTFSSVTSKELRPMKGKWLTLIFDVCPTLFVGTVNKKRDKKKRELGFFSAQKREYLLVSKAFRSTLGTTRPPVQGVSKFRSLNALSGSQWSRRLRRGPATARLLRLWVRIPPRAWTPVCCECCILSGRDLCDELITRPEESYWLWYVVEWDLETSWMRRSRPTGDFCAK